MCARKVERNYAKKNIGNEARNIARKYARKVARN